MEFRSKAVWDGIVDSDTGSARDAPDLPLPTTMRRGTYQELRGRREPGGAPAIVALRTRYIMSKLVPTPFSHTSHSFYALDALAFPSMRLSFQARPWDLVMVLVYSSTVGGALLLIDTGHPIAVLMFLLAPGYVLVAALFPDNRSLDWIFRLTLSVGVSFALVPLLALLLNFSPSGIRLSSLVGILTLFTIPVGFLAIWRRISLPPEQRLGLALELPRLYSRHDPPLDRALTVLVVVGVAFMASALGYVVLAPRTPDQYTTFYLLGANGTAGDYPSRLNVSEPTRVSLGVVSREEARTYTVFVDLVGVRLAFNETKGYNETIELNRTRWARFDFTLGNGETWERLYPFSVDVPGVWKLEFLLHHGGDFEAPYRSAHLMLFVGVP